MLSKIKKMKGEDKGKVFIVLSILGIILLIPLIKAKKPELGGDIMSTSFERIR